ncbi:hypothetical protein L3X38_001049 [Prunus dulcis]|uniref:Uncharacterized protein n=1 Tax=Prunus dulcis TaxID=3755 RepID=A0AAD4WTD2_PRUDU|nr:hypothetical protein L3X38_001049 [Prunus dulcis]
MATHDSPESLYRVLFDRCQSLEASYARLRAELHELRHHGRKEEKREEDDTVLTSDYSGSSFHLPRFFLSGSPYKGVLDSMGHAVLVCAASSGKINFLKEQEAAAKENQSLGSLLVSRSRDYLISKDGSKVPAAKRREWQEQFSGLQQNQQQQEVAAIYCPGFGKRLLKQLTSI